MIIDIKPIINNNYDCGQIIVATLVAHKGIDYEPVSFETWFFNYSNEEELIGKRIHCIADINLKEFLNKYFSIKSHIFEYNHDADDSCILELLKQGNPIVVNSDLYWCPWNISYKQFYFNHFYLIIGYDEQNNKYICIDPYITNKRIIVDFEEIKSGIKEYGYFEFSNQIQCYDMKKFIMDDCNFFIGESCKGKNNSVKNIIMFANDLKNELNYDRELNKYSRKEMHAVPLFDNIRRIFTYRNGYALLLKYIGKKINNTALIELSDDFFELGYEWQKIRNRLIKNSISKKTNDQSGEIAERILKVANDEQKMAMRIMDIVQ